MISPHRLQKESDSNDEKLTEEEKIKINQKSSGGIEKKKHESEIESERK
jgi:hypothetical protein